MTLRRLPVATAFAIAIFLLVFQQACSTEEGATEPIDAAPMGLPDGIPTESGAVTGCDSSSGENKGSFDASTGLCLASIASSDCPPTWDDTPAAPATCDAGGRSMVPFAGPRLGFLVRGVFFTLGGSACVYDATTRERVGAWNRVDSSYYCCGAAIEKVSGTVSDDLLNSFRGSLGGRCSFDGGGAASLSAG